MEANVQTPIKQPAHASPAIETEIAGQQNQSDVKRRNLHNSASYAARLWHSSVKHAHPQYHKGIDI